MSQGNGLGLWKILASVPWRPVTLSAKRGFLSPLRSRRTSAEVAEKTIVLRRIFEYGRGRLYR